MDTETFDNVANLTSSSEMLDEDQYWLIVEESLNNSADEDAQQTHLTQRLDKLTLKEIIGFRLRTDKLLYDTYNSELWCAASLMNDGCSDDGFEYFRNWVISRGKEVYYNALKNPDTLITQLVEGQEFYEFENFWYVALEAFESRTGNELYDYIDFQNFLFSEMNYPGIEFNWQKKNPDSMKAICPQLFAMKWKK